MSKSYTEIFVMSNEQNKNVAECVDNFRNRLRKWANEFNSIAEFERKCGIGRNTAGAWLKATKQEPSLPGSEPLIKIAKYQDISLNWLLLGFGSQKLTDCQKNEGGKLKSGSAMNPEIQQRIEKLESEKDQLFQLNVRLSNENERLARRIEYLEQTNKDLDMRLKNSEDEVETLRASLRKIS